jgi:hypothetical protein
MMANMAAAKHRAVTKNRPSEFVWQQGLISVQGKGVHIRKESHIHGCDSGTTSMDVGLS